MLDNDQNLRVKDDKERNNIAEKEIELKAIN